MATKPLLRRVLVLCFRTFFLLDSEDASLYILSLILHTPPLHWSSPRKLEKRSRTGPRRVALMNVARSGFPPRPPPQPPSSLPPSLGPCPLLPPPLQPPLLPSRNEPSLLSSSRNKTPTRSRKRRMSSTLLLLLLLKLQPRRRRMTREIRSWRT